MLKDQLPPGYKFYFPTEAQWEYAARGGEYRSGLKYAGSNDRTEVAWCEGSRSHVVKSKKANALGLYDMSGNVWEWCSDWYDEDYYGVSSSSNPQGPSSGSAHVIRGGSWNGDCRFCCVTHRGLREPYFTSNYNGFRVALVR